MQEWNILQQIELPLMNSFIQKKFTYITELNINQCLFTANSKVHCLLSKTEYRDYCELFKVVLLQISFNQFSLQVSQLTYFSDMQCKLILSNSG